MGKTTLPSSFQTVVVGGLVAGYAYALILSASAIAVCEFKRAGTCAEAWSQGYATSTGLVTTFLAYLIPPTAGKTENATRHRKEETDAST